MVKLKYGNKKIGCIWIYRCIYKWQIDTYHRGLACYLVIVKKLSCPRVRDKWHMKIFMLKEKKIL